MLTCCHLIGQFWDIRQPSPVMTLDLPERLYCADVVSGWGLAQHVYPIGHIMCGTVIPHVTVPSLTDYRIFPLVWWALQTVASSA